MLLFIINFWAGHLESAHTCKTVEFGLVLVLRVCCGNTRTGGLIRPTWASVGPAEPTSVGWLARVRRELTEVL